MSLNLKYDFKNSDVLSNAVDLQNEKKYIQKY